MSDIVIGIIAGSIVALVSFVLGLFGNMWYGHYQEKRHRVSEALRNHFRLLEEKVIQPIVETLWKLKYSHGEISLDGQGRHWSPDDIKIELFYETELHNSFRTHFKDFTNQIINVEKEVNNHNEQYDNFVHEIDAEITAKTGLNYGRKAPCLYPEIFGYFIKTLFDKANNSRLSYDFIGATVLQKGNDIWTLCCRSLDGSLHDFALFVSEQQGEECKDNLVGLLESQELLIKALKIGIDGISLNTKTLRLGAALDTMCWEYTILGKTLKKVDECQYCKVIFGKEPPP